MASEIAISALDWWQFNTEESGYWEKKKAQVSEQIIDLGIGKSELYSQSCHWPIVQPSPVPIFFLFPYTVSLFRW